MLTRRPQLLSVLMATLSLACGDDDSTNVDSGLPTGGGGGSDAGPSADSGPTGGTGTLDCAYLLSSDNCVLDIYETISANCASPTGEQGTLSADRSVCSFSDGTEVDFDGPVNPAAFGGFESYGFTIRKSGSDCVTWTNVVSTGAGVGDTQVSVTIVAATQTVSTSSQLGGNAAIMCPDGSSRSGPFGDLVACADDAPGELITVTPSSLKVEFTTSGGTLPLFDCAL